VSQCACMLRGIDDAGVLSVAGQPLLWVGWPLGFLQGADSSGRMSVSVVRIAGPRSALAKAERLMQNPLRT